MESNNQRKIQNVDSGEYETVMMIDTYLTERDLITLKDSAFAFSHFEIDENYIILNTVMDRIQNSIHKYESNKGEMTHKIKCPITDKEMEILNNANKSMNPQSSKSVIFKIQNAMEPANKLYNIDINIPLSFREEFEYSDKTILKNLCNHMSFNIIGRKDISPRYKLNTYITKDEYNNLCELSEDNSLSEDLRNFLDIIPQVTKEFSPENERHEHLSEIEENY